MADLTLSDGREVNFDISKLTLAEYRGIFSPTEPDAITDATLSKITGIDAKELPALLYADYVNIATWLLTKAWAKARNPNSVSASTTQPSRAE